MKKTIILLLASLLLLTACESTKKETFSIRSFTYAYQTSEVQDYTHDVYIAHCNGDIYVEVPETYYQLAIDLTYTKKIVTYYVYGVEHKVSNKGWEFIQEEK